MRIFLHETWREPDEFHQFSHTFGNLFRRTNLVHAQWFRQRIKNCHTRIERRVRVLKNHLHVAAHIKQRRRTAVGQILSFQHHSSLRRRHQLHHRPGERRFSAP